MPGSPLKRQRKAGVTDPVTGELVQFPRLTHPRAGLSHGEWRALGPGEKLERLFGMSLDDLYEIMSWGPIAELDPFRLSVRVQVTRVVFTICMKAFLDGRLGREAARERDRQRIIEELARLEFGTSNKTSARFGDFRGPGGGVARICGVVGYNVQIAVDTEHHLIVAHEVTNSGSDRSQLANMAKQAKAILQAEELAAVADRGYFNSPEILECAEAGITVTLPKPMTSGAKSQGRFGKQDFVYVPEKDVYRCPAGAQLTYRFTAEEHGKTIRRYWTTACPKCPLRSRCTTGPERRIQRWEHEHLLEAVQERLDASPQAMRVRRETVEHPFGTIKARMGATHFLTKTLPKVATEMALSVLAYNLTRVMNIVGVKPLIAAIGA